MSGLSQGNWAVGEKTDSRFDAPALRHDARKFQMLREVAQDNWLRMVSGAVKTRVICALTVLARHCTHTEPSRNG